MPLSAAITNDGTGCHYRTLNYEDPSLVVAAINGDTAAFDALAASYRKKILKIVRRITGNIEDAEDVTQQALMKAFVNIRSFQRRCSFATWLRRIAINEALMWRRKHHARAEVSWLSSSPIEEAGIVPEIADTRANPEQCYDKQERRQLVITAIKELKPASRLALEVCDLNERSLKDLALVRGISLSAAKSCLFRSRTVLRAKVIRFLRTEASEGIRASSLSA